MLVGVDLCNTLANINYELLQQFKKISLNQYPAPEVPGDFFTTPAGLKVFWKARPFYRAREVLFQMTELGYRIVYLTSRPKQAQFVTRRWLEVHRFPAGPVEFVPSCEKATVARDAGMVAFFDDDPTVISSMLEKQIPHVFIKAAPYNALFSDHSGVLRFNHWGQLTRALPIAKVRM